MLAKPANDRRVANAVTLKSTFRFEISNYSKISDYAKSRNPKQCQKIFNVVVSDPKKLTRQVSQASHCVSTLKVKIPTCCRQTTVNEWTEQKWRLLQIMWNDRCSRHVFFCFYSTIFQLTHAKF